MSLLATPPETSPSFTVWTLASAPASPKSVERIADMFSSGAISLQVPGESERRVWMLALKVHRQSGLMFEVRHGRVEATWCATRIDTTGGWTEHREALEQAAATVVRTAAAE